MRDQNKTKKQLIEELAELRSRVSKLEKLDDSTKPRGKKGLTAVSALREPQAQPEQRVQEHASDLDRANEELRAEIDGRMGKALRESEERYRYLVEASIEGILVNQDSTIQFANQALARMFGYDKPEEIVGRSIWETLVVPEEWAPLQARAAAFLRGEKLPLHPGWQGLRKDGKRIWVQSGGTRITWGNRPAQLSFMLDVTERKKAEDELRKSEERLRFIIESTADGIWEWDIATNIVFWSDRVYELLGLSHGGLSPTYDLVYELIHPEDRALFERTIHTQLESFSPYSVELRMRRGDGTYGFFLGRGQVIRDHKGKPIRMAGSVSDITVRKNADKHLRMSEERLRLALEAARMGTWEWDLLTNQIRYSDEMGPLFGLKRGETHPDCEALLSSVYRSDRDQVQRTVFQAVNSGAPSQHEFRVTHPDGSVHWFENKGQVVCDDAGKPVRMLGVILDITERKKAEEDRVKLEAQIQHAQKLESLGILAGGIAHDFNNLLVGVLGNAELALLELSADSPIRQRLMDIRTTGIRASELTNQMLAYSGKGRFLVKTVHFNGLIKEMVDLLGVSISKKVEIGFELADDLPTIEADAAQMRQVVMNLITNASEAIGERNGVITLKTGRFYADHLYLSGTCLGDSLSEGYYIFIEVSDNGCGMDEETRLKIFDPFFTTKFTGRGLGLAAVLGIIRGHGGTIKVCSRPTLGSTFRVLFPSPSSRGTVLTEGHEASESSWHGQGTILVIDDEEAVREVAESILERWGFTVLCAKDGIEGLQLFEKHAQEITLVLLDMTMPKMSGEEVYKEICRIRPESRVLLTSGYDEQDATDRFVGRSLAGFLQKPFQFSSLFQKLQEALGSDEG